MFLKKTRKKPAKNWDLGRICKITEKNLRKIWE